MNLAYRLLNAFEETFRGVRYRHRNSTIGDQIAVHLYEDIYDFQRSPKFNARVDSADCVVNLANTRRGVPARRGDGTFGQRVPNVDVIQEPGFNVRRAQLATIEIGIEVKILFKAMIKQIDRVGSDLRGQAAHFKHGGDTPITLAIVGVNFADHCTSYEGPDRPYPTDGKKNKHPIQEAESAIQRLKQLTAPHFDHFLFLRFRATNVEPYDFEWIDADETKADYGAVLTRITRDYEKQF